MKLNLCIDAGNTRFKAALLQPADGSIIETREVEMPEEIPAALSAFIQDKPVRAAILSTVADRTESIRNVLSVAGINVITLDSRLALPIANAYHSPDTLGPDRLALATGGWVLYPGEDLLVISAGTCITYNFVTKTRTFRGGAISPGIHMRLRAMHHFTHALPEVSISGDTRLLGYDTETSLRSGAVIGAAAEVDGMVAQFEKQYPGLRTVLTGGDAPLLQRYLQNSISLDPHLAYKGLNAILNYHVPFVG
jgi:type III pantothenate kinase